MIVNLEEFDSMMRYRRIINQTDLDDIQWMRNGEEIKVTPDILEEWKFIGLSNVDFPRYNDMSEYGPKVASLICTKEMK